MRVLLAWRGPRDAAERKIFSRRHAPLLQHLVRQGVRPAVALLGDDGRGRDDLAATGASIDVTAALPPPLSLLHGLPRAVRDLRKIIDRFDPDIVEGDTELPAIAAALAARRHRSIAVYRRHFHAGRWRLHAAGRIAASLADRIIVSNDAMRRHVAAELGRPLEQIAVSSSGADEPDAVTADETAAARRSIGIGERDGVIAVIAYLRRDKGIDVLIRALDDLDGISSAHLIIAGSGPEEASLRGLAAKSKVPIHFLGHRENVALWISAADVVAIPSRGEAFGRTTLEAMALGRPLVASRVGGLAEAVIDGETGFLVAPENPKELSAALRTLLADQALSRRMGAAARARYESRFTIAHMATSWRETWEGMLRS